jgi:mono/diheme cytochrome c family protein
VISITFLPIGHAYPALLWQFRAEQPLEENMRVMKFISAVAILVTITSALAVSQSALSDSKPSVKHVPITRTPSNSGKDMYENYCAVCHGKDAKGTGPAASAMKTVPADLTQLAKNNGGKYPSAHVAAVIKGQATTASHGSQDMPVWGPLFSSISQGHDAQVQQRITNLVSYLEAVQAK